ncbi:hypothetical protein CAPTEDRAFT_147857 [Capitella teleta]|uniref:Solute carrier organic anion transporter family member n=1 Tax=Capitella teleta TaxID=283909 RepID=R7T5L9_CAPTE|nr:hypothetical protein CAPTEDRAFT_147857 [Capitella teleta]|eukprot:ELT88560.1 hypothetical protein CAPTEDRAFT_147857 [Capitella teleta]
MGINNVNTSTIERRFDMQSSQVAWITSSYDMASGVLGIILGYLGGFFHKGKIMTFGAGCLALGSFIMFSPHLFVGNYKYGTSPEDSHCDLYGNQTNTGCGTGSSVSNYIFVFVLGQMFHAIGGTAVFNTGLTILDDNVPNSDTALYVGIMHCFSALGPAVAFLAGGALLNLYVDIGRHSVSVSPGDPGWIGAWWIGFLISGIASVLVTFLMACFPREFPEAKRLKALKSAEAYATAGKDEMERDDFGRKWKDIWLSIKVIFCNPSWIFLTIAATVESGAVNSFATFLPKVLQFQFSLTTSASALFAGVLVVPGAAGGQLLGGIIPKCFNMRLRGLLITMTVCSFLGFFLGAAFLIKCPMPKIAGVNVEYFNAPTHVSYYSIREAAQLPFFCFTTLRSLELDEEAIVHECNARCHCTTSDYEPLCGHDGVEYFSPCHAECSNITEIDGSKIYSDCACIPELSSDFGQAREGICEDDCTVKFIGFLILTLCLMLTTFAVNTIGHAATIRCVHEKQRGFAYGIQTFIVRMLGNVPFPILMGVLFDNSCLVWQEKCDETTSCWIYDTDTMSVKLTLMLAVVKVISFVAFLLSYLAFKAPEEAQPTIKDILDGESIGAEEVTANHNNAAFDQSAELGQNGRVTPVDESDIKRHPPAFDSTNFDNDVIATKF